MGANYGCHCKPNYRLLVLLHFENYVNSSCTFSVFAPCSRVDIRSHVFTDVANFLVLGSHVTRLFNKGKGLRQLSRRIY